MPLSIRQKAPEFSLSNTTGGKFSLSKDAKNSPLIIFFYPKDFTKECTKEVCGFRDNFSFFKKVNIDVVGISTDSVKKHIEFKEQHQLPFELLSDVTGKVSKAYKAKLPFINMSKRITYLLDENHKIVAIHEGLLDGESHIKKMTDAISKL